MSIIQKSELKTETPDVIEKEDSKEFLWQDDSYKGILKAITWPKFGNAIKYTVYSLISSAAIGGVLYFYSYGINQLVGIFT